MEKERRAGEGGRKREKEREKTNSYSNPTSSALYWQYF